ncbi:type II toxin-antitoxin system VapC family toxin [Longimicrobium terrae]|uniref:Putative nucleic acid-binding protein n=1 Tax=Longimicrobium terrae TaxID=1639882 RepID=A0A841H448_9BACT|nr:type II toxin-antitoxin system VapC family toxin [Longimicrobium terrae]MBB4638535.1 putative nucleic acid-binding protein [Longimicrobium terrae]MBB6072827.1 putative nucleic acid-binding protein [Longimicrobium terrae]NNC30556.1 type II toxin-antitoxin system VapC family toxin [Longimicrobium terrae]
MSNYVIDTQLYVRAIRNRAEYEKLRAFTSAFSPSVYLCSVVAQELLAGSRPEEKRELMRTYIEPFEDLGRTVVPTHWEWRKAGTVLNGLRARGYTITAAFTNDVLIACTANQIGAEVIHDNFRDYHAIQQLVRFRHRTGYPTRDAEAAAPTAG